MSTSELFLQHEEVEDFIRETLSDDFLYKIGEDDSAIGLCPYISFYIYHTPDDYLPLVDKMVAIYKAFEQLIDEPFQIVWKDDTQEWLLAGDKRLPNLDDFPALARKQQEDLRPFWIRASDQESSSATARWAFCAKVDNGGIRYTTLKLTFRHKWYNRNKARWNSFVKDCLVQLQPEHCYSGFEIGNGGFNILGAYESEVLERICADYFYAMDIDHLSTMAHHSFYYHRDDPLFDPEALEGLENLPEKYTDPTDLGAGLRPPTWCFLLTPFWLAQLGKTEAEVRIELEDPCIEITAIPFAVGPHNPNGEIGLWIRLGELDLHPVENGVPELLVRANRLIRPIRCDDLNLLTLDAWDDDPNPRFDDESSQRWMRRFDDDSDWPDANRRKPAAPPRAHSNVTSNTPCPAAGWWFTPAQTNSRRYFKRGEIMPSVGGDYGDTFWQWSPDQSVQ